MVIRGPGPANVAPTGLGGRVPRLDDNILFRRYHEQGDLPCSGAMIEQYMSLVRSLARRYFVSREQLEDLRADRRHRTVMRSDLFYIKRASS